MSKHYTSKFAIRQAVGLCLTSVAIVAMAAPPAPAARGTNDCTRGPGYGMYGRYGMGPDMMGGGMGPGMMGGGMGPGMMGGYGEGHGMGMGAQHWARIPGMNLSDEQRAKINRIADDTRKAHWTTVGAMMDQQARLRDLYGAQKPDEAAIDDAYKTIGKLRSQMYDSTVDAHKRMEAVLSKEQQDVLHRYWR